MKTPAQIKAEGRMPTVEELEEFYDALAVDKNPEGVYLWGNTHIDESFGRTRFAQKHILPGMSVLECGCCDGGMSRHIINSTGAEGYVTLLDISPRFVERAKKFIGERPNVEFCVGDAATFSTRRRYDVIVAMEIMEHVPDPRKLISNLWGLLKKHTGKILITVPADVPDRLGEHLHEFNASDIAVLVGDSLGMHVSTFVEGKTVFAVIDKEAQAVQYVG